MDSVEACPSEHAMLSRLRASSATTQPTTTWIAQQYTSSLIVLSVLIIVFHPAFHFILELLPDIPPDSLLTRLVSVAVAMTLLVAVLLFPQLRRFSPWFQILNAGMAIIVTHLVVLDSGNHPMYLAASLTAVYATQLSFIRMREWVITVAIVFTLYLFASAQRGVFAAPQGWVPPLFYVANYTIATALIYIRVRLQRREMQSRLTLQRTNEELRVVTERLQSELDLARDIQQSLLPPAAPTWPRLDVVCYSQPAREVGGDFYSYHRFDDGRLALAVGDVSGKGASAALLMATSLSLFNAQVVQRLPPPALMANLDRSLVPYTQPRGQNCALCYIELDGCTLCIVNAGAIPPYVRHTNGRIEWPDVWGFALGHGLGFQTGYHGRQVMVAPGDLIVLVSDGVVEARNRVGEMFSFGRLEQAIARGPTESAQVMVDHLLAELRSFVGATEAHDDATIAVVRVE
jgi:serine phosphatase RsbU (regulator of sigma subunit)